MKNADARLIWLALLGGALLSACTPAPKATLRFAAPEDGSPPRYGETPFPSDLYRDKGGRLVAFEGMDDIMPLESETAAAHLITLDGFGLRPVVEVFVDGELDPGSVPALSDSADASLFVIDVDATSPHRGHVAAMEWRLDPARRRIAGVTELGTSLREGTRYAVVVRDTLRDAAGTPLRAPPHFASLLEDPANESTSYRDELRSALDELALRGVERGDVVLASTFTTQHATRDLLAARRLAETAPAPTLRFDDEALVFRGADALDALLGRAERDESGEERWGWSNPTGLAHDHVGVIATGIMTAPNFVHDDDGSFLPHADAFRYDAEGLPLMVDPAAELPVSFALPAAPPPTGGYPVAIFGHGLGASRHQLVALAEPLTSRGWAVVAIDHHGHGSRFVDRDEDNNTPSFIGGFDGDASLRDGFGDVVGVGSTFAFLHEMKNLTAMRDSIRQSVIDLGALVRLLRSPDLDLSALGEPGASTELDGDHIVYLGESFGGVVGAVLSAVEPDLDLFVLDVPGGGIFDLALLGSPVMRPLVELWVSSTYGLDERLDRFHPIIGVGQALIDGADPLSFAPYALADRLSVRDAANGPRHVVLLEVVGDEVMPNRSTRALARAYGMPLLAPYFSEVRGLEVATGPQTQNLAGQTAALVQWAPATHGANWTSERGVRKFFPFGEGDDEEFTVLDEAVTIRNPMRETWAQVSALLESHLEGAATLEPTQLAKKDFDDDGLSDDEEHAQGRDPYAPGR
jgi:hypothetical protein